MITVFIAMAFVGVCAILATYSAFYMYKFISSYTGKFKTAVTYLFFNIALFTLLVTEFGVSDVFNASLSFSILFSLTAIVAFVLLTRCSKKIYDTEASIIIEAIEEKKRFLMKKSKLLQEKYLKRRITEDMFKDLLMDIEKEIIDADARILQIREEMRK